MASTQGPWPTVPLTSFTSPDSPHCYPTYVPPSINDQLSLASEYPYQANVNDQSQSPLHFDQMYPSIMPPAMQQAAFSESTFDSNLLDPNVQWPSREANVTTADLEASETQLKIRSGIDPIERAAISGVEIPSLEDQARTRKWDNEISKVRNWLAASTLGAPNRSSSFAPTRSRSVTSPALNHAVDKPVPISASNQPPPKTSLSPLLSIHTQDAVPTLNQAEDYEDDNGTFPFGEDSNTPPAPIPGHDAVASDARVVECDDTQYQNHEPWTDLPHEIDSARIKEQPPSSNAAISVFMRKAKDLETASLTATLGSRRRSEADLSSLVSSGTTGFYPEKGVLKSPNKIRRFFGGNKKRYSGEGSKLSPENSGVPKKSTQGGLSLKRARSRSRGPEIHVEGQPSLSPTNLRSRINVISRLRSPSTGELSNPAGQSHLAKQWLASGGPPVPSLRTQEPEVDPQQQEQEMTEEMMLASPDDGDLDRDEEEFNDSTGMASLRIDEAPLFATKEAFKAHASKLNSHIELYMLDRMTQEQDKRFRRLMDYRRKHEDAIERGHCQSGMLCAALGSGPNYLTPSTLKGAEGNTPIFFITQLESVENSSEVGESATFPEGIPLPPVERLPAEFECPLCFQVKRIGKPSDWTKHVNEDIQPFTCTFPSCSEAKSFKRKADWVRHESERHRHLEAWHCDLEGCSHRCYRRDNFVQHLVREHRLPEPPMKITKNTVRGGLQPFEQKDAVARQVEKCHQESTKRPRDEPCRFCGTSCESWKKLSRHLALHMQQISIPILKLMDIEIPKVSRGSVTTVGAGPHASITKGQSKQPQTPLMPRTPRTFHQRGGSRSNPQHGSSSSGFQDPGQPSVTVTDTTKGMLSSSSDWMMQGAPKDVSRYSPSLATNTPRSQPFNALGVKPTADYTSISGGQPYLGQYGHSPLTPQTPGFGVGGSGYAKTYPPTWIDNQTTSPPSALGISGVFTEAQLSTSPVEASSEVFGSQAPLPVGEPAFDFPQEGFMGEGPQTAQNQFYAMQPDVDYSQGFDYAVQRHASTFTMGSRNEGEEHQPNASTGHHSATYPPQYFP